MQRRNLKSALCGLVLMGWLAALAVGQPVFRAPERFTQADTPLNKISMSRSTSGVLLWTPQNKLALAYYEGGLATTQNTPSRVMFREWNDVSGWAPAVQLDHSLNNGNPIGGRHPAMALLANGGLFCTWHDHRHSTAIGTWNDNQEIYGSTRPADDSSFPAADQRLTLSSAGGSGDNSYTPKAARLPDGRVALVWYDYGWGSESEIALRLSGPDGIFPAPPPMADVRLTTPGTRLSGDAIASFTMPSLAADSAGNLHLLWVTGTTAAPANMYYARYDVAAGKITQPIRLAQARVSGYFDPPKLIVNPANDDLWVLYTDSVTNGNKDIYLRRKPAASANFDAPIRVTTSSEDQQYPQACFDPAGLLHLVYTDSVVHYAQFNPATQAVQQAQILNPGMSGTFSRPAITLDPDQQIHVVWEEEYSTTQGDLWFTTTRLQAAVAGWQHYD